VEVLLGVEIYSRLYVASNHDLHSDCNRHLSLKITRVLSFVHPISIGDYSFFVRLEGSSLDCVLCTGNEKIMIPAVLGHCAGIPLGAHSMSGVTSFAPVSPLAKAKFQFQLCQRFESPFTQDSN
jgi:hypothetical protein